MALILSLGALVALAGSIFFVFLFAGDHLPTCSAVEPVFAWRVKNLSAVRTDTPGNTSDVSGELLPYSGKQGIKIITSGKRAPVPSPNKLNTLRVVRDFFLYDPGSKLAGVCEHVEILDLCHQRLLIEWCKVVAALELVHKELTRVSDFISVNGAGTTTQSGMMRNWLQLLDKLVKIGGELGLSPSSHAGLRLDKFIRRKGETSAKYERGRSLVE